MNCYPQKNKQKNKAFTLFECLLALLILSSIYSLMVPVIKTSGKLEERIRNRQQLEWHIFLIQLSKELEESHVLKLENNKLFLYKENGEILIVEQYKNVIRKRLRNGHQPLLTEVSQAKFTKEENSIKIEVIFSEKEQAKNYVAFYSLKHLDESKNE